MTSSKAVASSLAIAALLCGVSVMADETPTKDATTSNSQATITDGKTTGASAKASATASASSSSSASGGPGCQSSASSTAEAIAGGKRAYDSDHQEAHDADGNCSSSAKASATIESGENKPAN